MIDDHEAEIERIAALGGDYVFRRDAEALDGQVFALSYQLRAAGKAVPELATIERACLPMRPGSMAGQPAFPASALDTYRTNASLLRAALEGE